MDRVYRVELRADISLPIPFDIAGSYGLFGAVNGRMARHLLKQPWFVTLATHMSRGKSGNIYLCITLCRQS